jgi:hypothetical protein
LSKKENNASGNSIKNSELDKRSFRIKSIDEYETFPYHLIETEEEKKAKKRWQSLSPEEQAARRKETTRQIEELEERYYKLTGERPGRKPYDWDGFFDFADDDD